MANAQNIRIGKGLDDLPFGATKKQVLGIFGEPEEKDKIDLGDEISEAWHYWKLGLSMNFDENSDYKLCSIEVASPEVLLFDIPIIGMPRQMVKDFMSDKAAGNPVDEPAGGLSYPEISIDFWFNGDDVAEVQWGKIPS